MRFDGARRNRRADRHNPRGCGVPVITDKRHAAFAVVTAARGWSGVCSYTEPYKEAVLRSARKSTSLA